MSKVSVVIERYHEVVTHSQYHHLHQSVDLSCSDPVAPGSKKCDWSDYVLLTQGFFLSHCAFCFPALYQIDILYEIKTKWLRIRSIWCARLFLFTILHAVVGIHYLLYLLIQQNVYFVIL